MTNYLNIEVTDTYQDRWSGNYCWVERKQVELPPNIRSQHSIVRLAKKAIGWTGMRCDVVNYGDEYHIVPIGAAMIAYVQFGFSFEPINCDCSS